MIDIESLHKMWALDAPIKEHELDVSSLESPKLHSKYLELHNLSRMKLRKQQLRLDELKLEKWRYYTGKMTKEEMDELGWKYDPYDGCTKPLKSEITQYIESDKEVQTVKLKVEYYKVLVDAIEEIMGNIKWRSTNIKNILEYRKFQSGM